MIKKIYKFALILLASTMITGMGYRPPVDPEPPSEPGNRFPVLMLHGWFGSSSAFSSLKTFLKNNGWSDSELYAFNMVDNSNLCSTQHAPKVAEWVQMIKEAHPGKKIALIGHSRGGLNAMEPLWKGMIDPADINYVVTLAGANNACISSLGPHPADETPGDAGPLYTFLWSSADFVNYSLTVIDGADSIEYSDKSHMDFVRDSEVFEDILDALNGNIGDNQ